MYRRFRSAAPYQTQTAGTAIVIGIPGRRNHLVSIDRIQLTTSSTLHVNTILMPYSRAILTAAAAASQAVINVSVALTCGRTSSAIASGDYVAVEQSDGSFLFTTFSSASSLAYTLAGNLTVAANANANVFCFGIASDTFQTQTFSPTVSSTDLLLPATPDADISLCLGRMQDAPLIYYNPNATGADFVKLIEYSHYKT